MSQTIQIRGQVSLSNSNLVTTINLTDTLTTTGNNSISNNANIATGSWQVLDQGSNGDFRIGYFANLDATSSIKIAIGSTGTASYAAMLLPGDIAIIPNSGSAVIYAQAVGAHSPVILQYLLSEQ
jgi:hypothetical protein